MEEQEEEIIQEEEVESSPDDSSDESPAEPAPAAETNPPRQPRKTGVLLTVFAVIVIVLVGALASYYYYTFQRQGMASEQVLRNVWDETVLVTIDLTNKFKQIDEFADLDVSGSDSFEQAVNSANRTIRDGIFDTRSQTGMSIATSTFAGKLNSFLDDYSNVLAEVKRIIARVDTIDTITELDQLLVYQDDIESSYDDLLLVSRGFIQANLPRIIFDMPDEIVSLLNQQIADQGTQEEQAKAKRQAAEQAVTRFVQAWQDRDADAMGGYFTAGARSEFNPGILEDSSDIVNFRILNTTLSEDSTAVEINGQLEKKTPDGVQVDEEWTFALLMSEDDWLIDSWNQN